MVSTYIICELFFRPFFLIDEEIMSLAYLHIECLQYQLQHTISRTTMSYVTLWFESTDYSKCAMHNNYDVIHVH